MKKVLLVLFLLLSINSCAQKEPVVQIDKTELRKEGVWIDTRLSALVTEYIIEANKRGINVIPHLMKMKYIGFSNEVQYPTLGVALKNQQYVYIGSFCLLDATILKVVVFHELTHAIFAAEHSECSEYDIMRAYSPKSFRVYEDKKFWGERLDELFFGKTLVLK